METFKNGWKIKISLVEPDGEVSNEADLTKLISEEHACNIFDDIVNGTMLTEIIKLNNGSFFTPTKWAGF